MDPFSDKLRFDVRITDDIFYFCIMYVLITALVLVQKGKQRTHRC
jgi:hypothetical protein